MLACEGIVALQSLVRDVGGTLCGTAETAEGKGIAVRCRSGIGNGWVLGIRGESLVIVRAGDWAVSLGLGLTVIGIPLQLGWSRVSGDRIGAGGGGGGRSIIDEDSLVSTDGRSGYIWNLGSLEQG